MSLFCGVTHLAKSILHEALMFAVTSNEYLQHSQKACLYWIKYGRVDTIILTCPLFSPKMFIRNFSFCMH